ncbi:MAG: winged helix-turn-helix transcriptional regulator [Nitrosotalea sp.]
MNWKEFFQISDIRILMYLNNNPEIRYSELLKNVVTTRSVLSTSLQDLRKRNLVDRTVDSTSTIQSKYRLTDKGDKLVQQLISIQKLVL